VSDAEEKPLTVGFDLDQTLVDSRPGILATYRALSAHTGVFVDADAAVGRLGPPLADELSRWFPAEQVEAAGDQFRALYADHAITCSPLLPGVVEALACVRAHGGRVVVITGKYEPNAHLHLKHLGVVADVVVGWAWGPGKTEALLALGAGVYVGDHPHDMAAAVAVNHGGSRVVGVGVGTGGWSAADLRAAGAAVVLRDLTEFPGWFEAHVRANGSVAA
jgi:phosphoglycolate phosphatase